MRPETRMTASEAPPQITQKTTRVGSASLRTVSFCPRSARARRFERPVATWSEHDFRPFKTSSRAIRCLWALLVVVGMARSTGLAQAPRADLGPLVVNTVRTALTPALPYPPSDELGELPADGTTVVPWMIRPIQDGDLTIEVLANPLNPANQARAAKAMAQIGVAIEAAQRRSQAAYEKALADAKRTGRSQDFDGITLGDEGVAGARIDAEAHVAIEVAFNQPNYAYSVNSSIAPAPLPTPVAGAVGAIGVPANVYRDGRDAATNERYCAAETHVFFGALASPEVHKRSSLTFEVTAATAAAPGPVEADVVRSVVVSLRGNAQLIEQIVRQADWARVQALVTGK
jgi:hypothetical protein